ncbi:MAG: hypothetical protein SW833_10145 [Cyanobacteriota bacterium]|nr:hypothetical protein [Cyanobacteriota bacterium]
MLHLGIWQELARFKAAIARLRQNSQLPIGRIFLEALELDRPIPDKFRLALESASQGELPNLKRFYTNLI